MINKILSFDSIGHDTSVVKNCGGGMGGGKLYSISMIRFIAMLMIIICHMCQYYDNPWAWWFNVGVQIFFVISGFLYGSKQITSPVEWFLQNAKKILLPYYLFLVPIIALYYIFSPVDIDLGSAIRSLLCLGTIDGIGHLWFVGYILFCYLITPILYEITIYLEDRSLVYSINFILAFMLIFVVFGIFTNFYFWTIRILCYIVGFFLPMIIKKSGGTSFRDILFWFISAAVISKLIYLYVATALPDLRGIGYVEGISHLFLGVALTLSLMYMLRNIKPLKILEFSDKYSYSIYIVHQLFILSPFTLMDITAYRVINIAIVLLVTMVSAVLLQALSFRVNKSVSKI